MMKNITIIIVFLVLSTASAKPNFTPPDSEERLKAIGSTEGLSETLQKALDPAGFEPISAPKPGDWLAEHYEAKQPYEKYINLRINKPDKKRNKIYIQPLGQFPEEPNDLLANLKEYTAAYFCMDVEVLPSLSLENMNFTSRVNPHTKNRQLLTSDILKFLRRAKAPDAVCLMAVTMEDLYPQPSWNFVFGQASLTSGVGVYSFARYDPAFYGENRTKDYEKILLRRSCKVLAHETAHMFSLTHCIYYKCIVNGSNNLEEFDAAPLHLCPVCLRKLQYCIGFDVCRRYRRLHNFYQRVGFEEDRKWVSDRLKWILGAEEAKAFIEQNKEPDSW